MFKIALSSVVGLASAVAVFFACIAMGKPLLTSITVVASFTIVVAAAAVVAGFNYLIDDIIAAAASAVTAICGTAVFFAAFPVAVVCYILAFVAAIVAVNAAVDAAANNNVDTSICLMVYGLEATALALGVGLWLTRPVVAVASVVAALVVLVTLTAAAHRYP